MAETTEKKFVDLAALTHYDEKVKAKIAEDDATTLKKSKDYADSLADNYDAAGTAATKVSELENGKVKANADAITNLNGDTTTEGSVAKQVADAKADLEKKITDSTYNDTALVARVTQAEQSITTLNGDGEGSVKKQIDDAINDFATKVSDDNVVNTFKELVDYCGTHGAEAAEMAGNIEKNKTAIATLETFVGKLPEGTSAKTVIDYINTKVSSIDFTEKIATAKKEAITAAATDAKTKADAALASAKTYADGLAKNYATTAQGAKADTALQKADIVTGATNGSISVKGEDIAVAGLKSAAFAETTAFEKSGAVKALADGQVTTNKNDIAALKTKVNTLESVEYTPITNEEIDALFVSK